jgi:hypothetical protein
LLALVAGVHTGKTEKIMADTKKLGLSRLQAFFMELFGLSRGVALAASLLIISVVLFAVFWFFHSAPPRTITISTGPAGSSFEVTAEKYRDILARPGNGVTLKILTSQGSLENLERLENASSGVDIGFVQGGTTNGLAGSRLVSLGSINYQPLLVFYRSATPMVLLSELAGKRVAIGPEGSGTRGLALALLGINGIQPGGATTLLELDAEAAGKALLDGSADAVFLMGDSAPPALMRKLLLTPGVQLYDFVQADGYTRRISYLDKLTLPRGSIDFGKDIPAHDVSLLGPTVELIARPNLHPALSDLLLEAARETNGAAGLFKRRGEFPAPLEHDVPISSDAARFYKSGKSFLYRTLPFWLASLVNRILVAFVPMVVILIPAVRIIPNMYRWRIRMLLYKWYRALLALEREPVPGMTVKKREEMNARLDEIETAVNRMRVPASFADQFYVLRQNIGYVRNLLIKAGK